MNVTTQDDQLTARNARNPPSRQIVQRSLAGKLGVAVRCNDYLDPSIGQYAQEIDVYQGTTAKDVMAQLRKVVASCRSFHDSQATRESRSSQSDSGDCRCFAGSSGRTAAGRRDRNARRTAAAAASCR